MSKDYETSVKYEQLVAHASIKYKFAELYQYCLVGDDGSVWSNWVRKRGENGRFVWTIEHGFRRRCPTEDERGYQFAMLKRLDGLRDNKPIHRLVLEVFVGPCPEGMECRHLDGNPSNNQLDNLVWGTSKENTEDQRRHGTLCNGSRNPVAKLTEAQVIEMRRLFEGGVRNKDLSTMFGVYPGVVSSIINRKAWKHV